MSDAAEDEFAGLPEEEEEFVDDEAGGDEGEASGEPSGEPVDGSGSVDSSEEEEDGQNEYEADGFLVDEEEAEGEGEEDEEGGAEVRKAKRKKRRRNFALDEEDYELLEDNQVRVRWDGWRRPGREQRGMGWFKGALRQRACGRRSQRDARHSTRARQRYKCATWRRLAAGHRQCCSAVQPAAATAAAACAVQQ